MKTKKPRPRHSDKCWIFIDKKAQLRGTKKYFRLYGNLSLMLEYENIKEKGLEIKLYTLARRVKKTRMFETDDVLIKEMSVMRSQNKPKTQLEQMNEYVKSLNL